MYVLITQQDGTRSVSEFTKLRGIRRYASDVMSGRLACAVWLRGSTTHAVSGEPLETRHRTMVNGRSVAKMEVVEPTIEPHNLVPENFRAVAEIRAPLGRYVVPARGGPQGIEPGILFPIHRDPETTRRYIITRAAAPDAPASDEVRFYLDASVHPVASATDDDDPTTEW